MSVWRIRCPQWKSDSESTPSRATFTGHHPTAAANCAERSAATAASPLGSRNPVTTTKAGTNSAAITPPAENNAHQNASLERFIGVPTRRSRRSP